MPDDFDLYSAGFTHIIQSVLLDADLGRSVEEIDMLTLRIVDGIAQMKVSVDDAIRRDVKDAVVDYFRGSTDA